MYKSQVEFDDRMKESQNMRTKYPDRIPTIIEPKVGTVMIDKRKFMVPELLTIGQLTYVIRKRLALKAEEAIFLFANSTVLIATASLQDVYKKYQDLDGFLYLNYALENTFG